MPRKRAADFHLPVICFLSRKSAVFTGFWNAQAFDQALRVAFHLLFICLPFASRAVSCLLGSDESGRRRRSSVFPKVWRATMSLPASTRCRRRRAGWHIYAHTPHAQRKRRRARCVVSLAAAPSLCTDPPVMARGCRKPRSRARNQPLWHAGRTLSPVMAESEALARRTLSGRSQNAR